MFLCSVLILLLCSVSSLTIIDKGGGPEPVDVVRVDTFGVDKALGVDTLGAPLLARMSSPGVYQVDRQKAFQRYETVPLHQKVSTAAAEMGSSEFVVAKDFNLNTIKVIDNIVTECYDASSNDCDYTLTDYDRRMLSLYVSVIENCGDALMDVEYSLGLLRDKDSENVMGMYAYGGTWAGSEHKISYWIRLHWNDGTQVHDHKTSLSKFLAVLELAVHERAHHEYKGSHDNFWQMVYNTIYGRAIRNLDKYVALAENILGEPIDCANKEEESTLTVLWIVVIVLLVGILIYLCIRQAKT